MYFDYLMIGFTILFLTVLTIFYNRQKRSQKYFEENSWFVDLTPKYTNKKRI